MMDLTLFVGLDVHKKTISVATVEGAAGRTVRFYGTIANTPDDAADAVQEAVAGWAAAAFCYEAGPCGYDVQRLSDAAGAPL